MRMRAGRARGFTKAEVLVIFAVAALIVAIVPPFFRLSGLGNLPEGFTLSDAWDFGPESFSHCSYAYHLPLPFVSSAVKATSDPRMAVCANTRSPIR